MKTVHKLLLICLAALVLRLVMIGAVRHPGISDPNYYYNQGRELIRGNGFEIDFIWHYYNPPERVVHPADWWLPLTSILAAGGMAVFGVNVQAALVPFVLLAVVIAPLTYLAARQFACSEETSLFAAAAAGVLPEFYLNSLRTNTVIPNVIFISASVLCFVEWWRRADGRLLLISGVMAGLGYLTRSEDLLLLPAFAASLPIYVLARRGTVRWNHWPYFAGALFLAGLVVLPWLLRNQHVFGWMNFPDQQRIFFWTDFRDLYAYDRPLTFDTMLDAQGWNGIISKRIFEMLASVKVMITSVDLLAVIMIGGGLLVVARRERDRLLTLTPTLLLLAAMFGFYTVLAPFFSQGGSFKKAYLSLVPMLIPVAAYMLDQAIPDRRLRRGAMALVIGLMTMNAVEMMRADIRFTNNYLDEMQDVADTLNTLPDTNADGEIVVMAQDQFMLGFLGVRSVVIPMEDRDTVLEVAQRYGVDYLMMPPARPSLDPLFNGTETDPRFVPVARVAGTNLMIYGFEYTP